MSENVQATSVATASVEERPAQTMPPTGNTSSGKGGGKTRARWESRGLNIAIIVSAVLVLAGIVLWIMQLSGGMVQTNMRNLGSWGLYITMFMFLVGLSAGGLIISSIPKAFGMEGFGGISKIAVWTSICCTVLAIGFVVVDLGQPLRLWELFVYSNMMSPLMWDIIVLATYLVLSVIYLWAQLREERGRMSHKALRVISVIALVCAVLVHSVTAWIFGLQMGREMWYTALLGPWFVSSALVCGTALVMIVVAALRKVGYINLEQKYLIKLAKMLGAFVCVDVYFFACDLLTSAFPGAEGAAVVQMLVTGPLAPFFWIEILGCAVCAVICFAPQLRTTSLLVVGSVLAILAIFCKRVQLLVGGFQIPNLDYPTTALTSMSSTSWEDGLAGIYGGMVYWPSPLEFGIMLGVVALGVLMLCLGLKYLPLRVGDKPAAK